MDKQNLFILGRKAQDTGEESCQSNDEPYTIKIVHLEDGRRIPIISGGMVDVAIRELGAKVAKIDYIEVEKIPDKSANG